jgi:hypothetical protein
MGLVGARRQRRSSLSVFRTDATLQPTALTMRLPIRQLGILVVLAMVVLVGGLTWYYYPPARPDVNEVGGTILVYQITGRDPNSPPAAKQVIADHLQRLCTYGGHPDVKVLPAAEPDRVVVCIPRTSNHMAEVQRIKNLANKSGRLEFRILANHRDDQDGIAAAQQAINQGRDADPKLEKALKDAQIEGVPPPGPRDSDGNPKKYRIDLAGGARCLVTYSWVDLGDRERRTLNLDGTAKDDVARNAAWKEAFAHRGKAVKLPAPAAANAGGAPDFLLDGAIFYSRACENRNLPEEDRRSQEVDYFVLGRDPEFDANGKRTPDIDGSLLTSAFPDRDQAGKPVIGFSFGPAGAELFSRLTRNNVTEAAGPDAPKKVRHLAIILDGEVMSAASINTEIRDRGSISGSFTNDEANTVTNILRAGRLPPTALRLVKEIPVIR